MHQYTRHIGDYQRDTGMLTPLEHGVYNLLLDWYYSSEKPLPVEWCELYRICRCRTRTDNMAVQYVIKTFFKTCDTGYCHKRCDEVIAKCKGVSDVRAQAARKRWAKEHDANAEQLQCKCNASAMQVPCKPDATLGIPLSSIHSPSPEGVSLSKDNSPKRSSGKKAVDLENFEFAWGRYGRKGSKKLSRAEWVKLDGDDQQSAINYIDEYKRQMKEPQFLKDFERYLKHRVWEGKIVVWDDSQIDTSDEVKFDD